MLSALNASCCIESVEVDGPEISAEKSAAKEDGVAVVLGISERMTGGFTCFNSQVFIDKSGTLLGVYRKLQPTYVERTLWGQGGGGILYGHLTVNLGV